MGAATVAALALAIAVGSSAPTTAQQGPQSVAPGTAAIWTDRQQYTVGDPVQVCYAIPIAGQITIANIPPGSTPNFYQGPSSGTSGCQSGVATPPVGQNCLRLTYPLFGGSGQTQTCFQIVGANPPAPPTGLSIRTDRTAYRIGDPIQICYSVPAPGPIVITDILASGEQQTFFSGYDDGTGGCIPGTITPPAGTECMRITFANQSAQTCFLVLGAVPPPPSGWTQVGSAQVDGNGNWNFDGQFGLAPGLTYLRVTSGQCGDNPASTLVWEVNLQRDASGPLGVDVWDGDLAPTGLAVSSGGAGHARIARPVTLNPITQIDATLFGVGIVYTGTTLTACFRSP
jgi:hypothetical protein